MPVSLDFAKYDLMDALDLAVLIEVEALQRYEMFAQQLGHRYDNDPYTVFVYMAENEGKHAKELYERREKLFGDTPKRVSRDDIFDVEAPEVGAADSSMSPLAAFQVALSSEKKAYDFYDRALAHVSDPEIRALFTELRDEEAEHVRMVEEAMANLPPGSDVGTEEDEDELPAL
jgi:erythrin-vacuolar iron transport family protein